jgi:polyprenyl-phospho-N-acetylgalactosaminyl synthase
MRTGTKVFVVVAAYNEQGKIGAVIDDLHGHGYRDIIVVDDHSRDTTAVIARRRGAIVLRHPKNKGQGAALRTGIRDALARGADIIITFDGDGQHQAKDIPALIAPITAGKADIALGSRFLGQVHGISFLKLITLKVSILVERLLLGVRLTDVHNGLRALSRRAAQTMHLTCDGMAHASEFIVEIRDHGLRYVEVPVTILYDKYAKQKGQSVFNSFRILGEIRRMRRERRKTGSPHAT